MTSNKCFQPNRLPIRSSLVHRIQALGRDLTERISALGFASDRVRKTRPYLLALGVNLRKMNSCTTVLSMRSLVLIATFSKTNPAPRLDGG